jgi:hypothetical protein
MLGVRAGRQDMDYSQVNEWGLVETGTTVKGADGQTYLASNQKNWVVLVPPVGGEVIKFGATEKIDHDRFTFPDAP